MNPSVVLADASATQPADPEQQVNDAADKATDTLGDAFSGDTEAIGVLVVDYLVPAGVFLLILIVAYFVGKFLGRLASTPVKNKVDETLGTFVAKLVFWAIMVGAILGALQYVGIGIASFAAVIAAAGFAVGLAFQGTLSNFAAGVMVLVFRPFKVGQVVSVAGITAKVNEVDLFTTCFDTFDNRRIIVPNSEIFGSTIENVSHHAERRVDVAVGTAYSADLQATRAALQKAADSVGELIIPGEGRGTQVYLNALGDSAVSWAVRVWVPAAEYWAVKENLTAAVKNELDAAGIGIPFPQMDVHLDK